MTRAGFLKKGMLFYFVLSPIAVLAQKSDTGHSAAACGACSTVLLFIVGGIALNIALLIWVARDAKSRGMDSAILWMLLVLFTGPIGLIIYILTRPQGSLTRCFNCGNNRLAASMKCPHCHAGVSP